ncbi:MAG: hypothetical protein IKU84_05565 [Clostridia bacterium]|nr:hypothetical protein [Clostridia bacterium]
MKKWLEKYNILTKALAVLIAVVLWIYVVSVVDPMGEITVSDVTPTYTGSEELLNTANLIVGNKAENLVDLRLAGTRQALSAIDETNIKVEVDISKTREAGVYELAYKVILPSNDVSVISRNPDRLSVKIDKIVTATVPIKVVLEGSVAEGYIAGEASTVPGALSVMGLAEDVSRISYAQVIIGKKDLNTSIHDFMEYTFFDAENKALDLKSVQTENSTVEVSFPVLKTKKVPLTVELVEGGGAKEKNVSYEITPADITIAGDEKTIDALNEVNVGAVYLSKYSNDAKIPFKLTMPEGVENMSGETNAEVSVKFNGLAMKNVETSAIEITNPPKGYEYDILTNSLTVLVRGDVRSITNVLPQNVRVVIDLSGSTVLSAGQHTLTGQAVVDGVENAGAVGEYRVLVRVSK